MPNNLLRKLSPFILLCSTVIAQLPFHKVVEPAGKAIDKALAASWLTQPDAKPFHVKLTIAPVKGDASVYSGTIEETWVSPTQWKRVVTAPGVSQTTVVNATGTHYVTQGSYYPMWLHKFVIALFNPIPDIEQWDKLKPMMEHLEGPKGPMSTPCAHSEFYLGTQAVHQINFANVCIKDGLMEMVQESDYAAEFSDYVKFGKLRVARTISIQVAHDIRAKGTLDVLEPAAAVDNSFFSTPEGATDKDPLQSIRVGTEALTKLAGGDVHPAWPNPIPGAGMFTVWVSVDEKGTVRETYTLNTDESGFAADMAATLIGQQWKSPIANGTAIQVQGPLVFAYPPKTGTP